MNETMAKKNVAEVLVDVLVEAGVQRIYGVAGDSLNGITDTLRQREQIPWVGLRHEKTAAFAAGAEAHLTTFLSFMASPPQRARTRSPTALRPRVAEVRPAFYDLALTPALRIIASYQRPWNPLPARSGLPVTSWVCTEGTALPKPTWKESRQTTGKLCSRLVHSGTAWSSWRSA